MSMEKVDLRLKNMEAAARSAAAVLADGGVILYPTDTLYGLGADAFSDAAVDTIYTIKGRDPHKPIHAIFSDMEMVEKYAEVTDAARKLARRFLPGPLTLVLKKKRHVTGGIARDMETIGIRIPDNQFCIEVARMFGKPFTATSANVAGMNTENSVEKIVAQLGTSAHRIACAFDSGELPVRAPSTVVDVSTGVVRVLRDGAISGVSLERVLEAGDIPI